MKISVRTINGEHEIAFGINKYRLIAKFLLKKKPGAGSLCLGPGCRFVHYLLFPNAISCSPFIVLTDIFIIYMTYIFQRDISVKVLSGC
jgi:hypothetical protein